MTRLTSLADSSQAAVEAVESANLRKYLLGRSMTYTMQHPLFGIGPGQFSNVVGKESRSEGRVGAWMETHNMFTQVSSECGIPALLLFVAGVGLTLRQAWRLNRSGKARGDDNPELIAAATCVLLSLTGFCTAATFLNLAYRLYLPSLSGLVIAMGFAAQAELFSKPPAKEQPTASPWAAAPNLPPLRPARPV